MSVLGCSRRSNRRPAASGLPRPADIFSFFLAPYEAIDLGAADRLAQDQRVGPSDLPDDLRLSRILLDVASREGLSGRKIACA